MQKVIWGSEVIKAPPSAVCGDGVAHGNASLWKKNKSARVTGQKKRKGKKKRKEKMNYRIRRKKNIEKMKAKKRKEEEEE